MGFMLTKRIYVSELQKESPISLSLCLRERERESMRNPSMGGGGGGPFLSTLGGILEAWVHPLGI